MKNQKERLLAIDNMKAFLIGCVVLGHLCEVIRFPYSSYLYLLIYSFHMPAFVFLSGFCSSREVHYDKIARNYIMALLVGFDESVGYYMSLSRAIVFFPFFLAGFYGKEYGKIVFPQCFGVTISHKQILRVTTATVAVGIAILLFEYRKGIKVSWLYQAAAYEKWHYNAAIRLGAIICAVLMIHFLCVCTPNRKIPFVTKLGQNTMPVFLLHGFVIRLLKYYPIPVMKQSPVLWSVLLIVLLLSVLSSKTVKKLCKPILSYPF